MKIKTFKEFLLEKAPPGKKAEEWILKNKSKFKQQYGDYWEKVLYATAWKLFGDSIEEIDVSFGQLLEQSAPSTTTTGGVANPDAKPVFKKTKFIGHPCIEVDEDTYMSCIMGKAPYKRWKRYIQDDDLRSELQKMYSRNKRVLIKNSKTGGMVFIK